MTWYRAEPCRRCMDFQCELELEQQSWSSRAELLTLSQRSDWDWQRWTSGSLPSGS